MPSVLLVHDECDYTWPDPDNDDRWHFCMMTPGHNGLVHVCSCSAAALIDPEPATEPVQAPAAKSPYTPRRRCMITRLSWALIKRR